ncbi:MAG TPA: ATP synthase F0 subunit B [Smithella sp.]|nr:ATP synthase F0 subunit B [Smithella sp.]HRS97589.1 ATP synthase F0 subunit B [Smithella sp.]
MKKTWSWIAAISTCLVFVGIALASGEGEGGHSAEKWIDLGKKTFNFVVLIGLLYWLLAAKIKDFFVGRRAEIKESIEKAAERKAEAEKKFREYSEKLDKASMEIDNIFEMIKAQGVAEKQKIIEDAERTAKKMKEDAQARIEQETKKATDMLKAQAVEISVQMAEEILKKNITQEDHAKMVKEYIDKVVTKH